MMGIPVLLKQVAEELEALPDGWTAYIHCETGELYSFSDEEAAQAEGEDERADWEMESVAKAREVLDSEAWIALPNKFEINEWFEFKKRALEEIAREALEEAGIPFSEGPRTEVN